MASANCAAEVPVRPAPEKAETIIGPSAVGMHKPIPEPTPTVGTGIRGIAKRKHWEIPDAKAEASAGEDEPEMPDPAKVEARLDESNAEETFTVPGALVPIPAPAVPTALTWNVKGPFTYVERPSATAAAKAADEVPEIFLPNKAAAMIGVHVILLIGMLPY